MSESEIEVIDPTTVWFGGMRVCVPCANHRSAPAGRSSNVSRVSCWACGGIGHHQVPVNYSAERAVAAIAESFGDVIWTARS